MSQIIKENIINRIQSSELDKQAVNINKIPSEILMEEAAEKIYGRLFKDFKNIKKLNIAIICGWGNNGGDSLSLARKLFFNNINTDLYIFNDVKGSKLYELHNSIISTLNINVFYINKIYKKIDEYDLIIDSIFGIGYKYRKNEKMFNLFSDINNSKARVISIDTPSGLDENNEESIIADYTYNVGFYKKYFFSINNRKKIGKIKNLKISFDLKNIKNKNNTFYIKKIMKLKKIKNNFVHKYSRGSSLSIGGDKGKFGSIIYAAESALSVGSGISLVITEDENVISINNMSKKIIVDNFENINKYINKYETITIGPGLGLKNKNNIKVISDIIESDKQFILDASFFTLFNKDVLNNFKRPPVLTPHSKEFSTFFKEETDELTTHTIETVRNIAVKYNLYIILKDSFLTIAFPDGTIYIYDNPLRLMAQAGSGDILSGILNGIICQYKDIKKSIFESIRIFYNTAKILKKSNHFSYSPDKFINILQKKY